MGQDVSIRVIRLSRTCELQNAQDLLNNPLLDSGNVGDQDLRGQKVLQLWVWEFLRLPEMGKPFISSLLGVVGTFWKLNVGAFWTLGGRGSGTS